MRSMFDGLIPRDKSLDNVIDDLVEDTSIRDTILSYEPKKLKKKSMVSVLRDNFSTDASVFSGFERTIQEIETWFGF